MSDTYCTLYIHVKPFSRIQQYLFKSPRKTTPSKKQIHRTRHCRTQGRCSFYLFLRFANKVHIHPYIWKKRILSHEKGTSRIWWMCCLFWYKTKNEGTISPWRKTTSWCEIDAFIALKWNIAETKWQIFVESVQVRDIHYFVILYTCSLNKKKQKQSGQMVEMEK